MLALYRKYRPRTLNEVVGQESITKSLESSIKSGKISHAYLFTGPRGTGKTSVARILAHEINDFPYELEDSYLDIIEIDAASNTGVDNIRDLREKALIAPTKGKYKVYIIDEVHMLSKSAFNALLKTLEEPPEHVVFILATTDFDKVPVTITSRSQVYTFRLSDPDQMLSHLKKIAKKEKIKISEGALKIVVSRGGGSFRDSLSLLDQISTLSDGKTEISEELVSSCLGLPLDSSLEKILSAYQISDISAVSSLLKDLISQGIKPEQIAESLLKKIISSKGPETLPGFAPLLEKLPSVSAPFPEAKLLLALISGVNAADVASGDKFLAGGVRSLRARIKVPEPRNETPRRREKVRTCSELSETTTGFLPGDGREGHRPPEGTWSASEPENEKNVRPQAQKEVINLSEHISSLPLSPAISNQLKSCKILEENHIIHIYPQRKITKSILSRQGNRDALASVFDKEFIIHDIDELEKDPKLAKISDIMGNVQEVDKNGGIPF